MANKKTKMAESQDSKVTHEPNIKVEQNFMAEMVEVRVKMYACRVCSIRYENMEDMRRHYQEVHPTSPADYDTSSQDATKIKEEIMDDDIENEDGGYLFLDDTIQIPEGVQVLQIAQSGENGEQILLQVINPDENGEMIDHEEGTIPTEEEHLESQQIDTVERRRTRQQTAAAAQNNVNSGATPPKSNRGRKRKSAMMEPKVITPTIASTRSRRSVVPNIKSEFVYEGISHVTETVVHKPNNDEDEDGTNRNYTFIQDGDVITAFHVDNEVEADDKMKEIDEQSGDESGASYDENEKDYPPDYTPTSKTKKGRQVEPKEDDSHLRRFPCPFQGCKYIAKYRSNLWDHKKTHTGEKPYACNWPSCSMRFSQTHQLKLHLRSHTGERPYVCDWPGCNSAFSQKPGLKSHMLTHTGEKPFKCDFPGCGWTFRLKGALTDHKRAIHENAKKHVCEWPGCNKRFLQQCHLRKHVMGHADIKPFACDWPNCNYKAVTMAYVTNHRKTHTGEKNYECTFPSCNKRFVKSSHVNRHRQRCHPELFVVVHEDGDNEEDGESGGEDEDTNDASMQESEHDEEPVKKRGTRSRGGNVVYKLANQNDGDEEGTAAALYIQNEDEEGEICSNEENVQYINGSVVSESGKHYIIAEDPSGDGQSLMIELKKEKIDEEIEQQQPPSSSPAKILRSTRSQALRNA